ncbi:MAG: TolB family protein [Salinivirgaceae bacterium]
MKGLIPFLFIIFLSLELNAQEIKVTKIEKLELEHPAYFPKFGNSAEVLLFSGEQYKGLSIYYLATQKEQLITQAAGAGVKASMLEDGSVLYRTSTFNKGRKQTEEKIFIAGKEINYQAKSTAGFMVATDGKRIKLSGTGFSEKSFAPLGEVYYLWASLSPDKTKIVFTAAGRGSYVIDIKGTILTYLGYLNAPKWLTDHWVIGMNDTDDGHQIISSNVVAAHIPSGKRIDLTETNASLIALYPEVSPDGNRIVFQSQKGEIYLLDVSILD